MYKYCNTEESARRQKQLEHCLLQLMQTSPYAQITVGDICRSSGISRKSFYRYFSSKDDCLHALIDQALLEASILFLAESTPQESSVQSFEYFFSYWKDASPLLEALCQNQLTDVFFQRYLLRVTQEDPDFRHFLITQNHDDDFEQILFIVCGISGLIINWHLSGYQKTAAQMAATTKRLLGSSIHLILPQKNPL